MSRKIVGVALVLAGGLSAWTLPAAYAQTELLTNRSFDLNSDLTPWAWSGAFAPPPCDYYPYSPPYYACFTDPNSTIGEWGNNLGGALYQQVYVPPNTTTITISYRWRVGTTETYQGYPPAAYDRFYVRLWSSSWAFLEELGAYSNLDAVPIPGGAYQLASFTRTQYAGRYIYLSFEGNTNYRYPSTFHIDDVSILATASTTGACCLTNGSCLNLTDTNCAAQGGIRWYANVTCGPTTCSTTTGACCLSGGGCSSLTQGACLSQGGTYRGDNISCASVNCTQPPARYTLTLQSNPSNGGLITRDPPPGADGKYAAGTQVQLTANPASGYSFSSWSGDASGSNNPTTVTMNGNKTVTANFNQQRYTLTLQSNPSNGGTIDASPQPGGDGKYAANTLVTLTAYPNTNYTFLSWSGDASGSDYTTTVTMSVNRSVTANFGNARDGILDVEPRTDFRTSAQTANGPYDPPSMTYRLMNKGGQTLTWTVSSGLPGGLPAWLNVSPTGGILQSGQSVFVIISVVPNQVPSSLCRYRDSLEFTNTTNGNRAAEVATELTVSSVCTDAAEDDQCILVPGIPGSLVKVIVRHDRLTKWNGSSFPPPSGLVPIDLNQPTYIFAHGWEGDTTVWDPTAANLALAIPNANILAYDWSDQANPNHVPDLRLAGAVAIYALLVDVVAAGPLAFVVVAGWRDVFIANQRAGHMGKALAEDLGKYPSLGSELHFVGKSLGGGLLASTAKSLSKEKTINSLTMIDSPDAYRINAMQYLDPTVAGRTLVFYYNEFLECGFGKPAPYPAINLRMDPEFNDDFCEHVTITYPEHWFPELISHGLVLDDHVFLFPQEIASLDDRRWWAETDYRYHFDPMGACCNFGIFGTESCEERLESDCYLETPFPVYIGDHTRCSPDGDCPVGTTMAGTFEQSGGVALGDVLPNDPFPGMVPILTLPLDSASEWQGDGAVVATALDPNDPGNSVVFLQENGDATIYRTFQWPANGVLLTFDYMFREPRGDENLTVYVDNEIVFYDHAGTTLATDGLMPGPSILIVDEAGVTGRLAFVLRSDGIPGGGVLLDNVRILAFVPTDANADRHVDLRDYALLQRCFGSEPPELECVLVDFDRDQSVALNDHAALQQCLAGPGVLGDARCNAPPVCGNGIVEGGEQCDPPNGRTCDAVCAGLVLEPDGSIVAWGDNYYGQTNPPPGGPNSGFVTVAAGGAHSLGLKSDGSIAAWGCGDDLHNNFGQCEVPAPIADFIAIAAGGYHSLGLKGDGSIVAWGNNSSGQTNVPAPNSGFVAISAGGFHNLGLKADGSIVGWASNYSGETNVPAPNTDFVAVAAGFSHSLGLKADGSIVAWGANWGGKTNVPAPNTGFVAVGAGYQHSLGLKADGSVVAWGCRHPYFDYGQCNVPMPNAGFVAVAAGHTHSLGLKADGSIVAWGRNDNGQTNVPAPNSGFTVISAGGSHSLAIRGNR